LFKAEQHSVTLNRKSTLLQQLHRCAPAAHLAFVWKMLTCCEADARRAHYWSLHAGRLYHVPLCPHHFPCSARLLKDANAVCGKLLDVKLMETFYKACVELIRAACTLTKALQAPKGAASKPSESFMDACAAVSHELIQAIYEVLTLNSEKRESVKPPTGIHHLQWNDLLCLADVLLCILV
jgi:hypothetical protein